MNTTNNNKSKTLWVGDIENWMEEKFLYVTFSEYASVKGVKLMRDRNTGLTLGYGFVEFENYEMANATLNNCNGKTIPNTNKLFKLNWASYGSGKNKILPQIINNNFIDTSSNNVKDTINIGNCPDYSIYVGDLDPLVNETLLKDFFLKFYDSVISTKIIMDPVTKVSKGYGFVKFKDLEQSQRALNEMNGKLFINKTMKTNQAAWKKNNTQESNTLYSYPKNNINSISNSQNYGSSQSQSYNYNNNNMIYNQTNINENSQIPQNNINYCNSNEDMSYLQNQYQQIYLNNLFTNYYSQLNNNSNVINQNPYAENSNDSASTQKSNNYNLGQNINPLYYQQNQQSFVPNQFPNSIRSPFSNQNDHQN